MGRVLLDERASYRARVRRLGRHRGREGDGHACLLSLRVGATANRVVRAPRLSAGFVAGLGLLSVVLVKRRNAAKRWLRCVPLRQIRQLRLSICSGDAQSPFAQSRRRRRKFKYVTTLGEFGRIARFRCYDSLRRLDPSNGRARGHAHSRAGKQAKASNKKRRRPKLRINQACAATRSCTDIAQLLRKRSN